MVCVASLPCASAEGPHKTAAGATQAASPQMAECRCGQLQPHCDLPLNVTVHAGVLQLGEETFTCMRHFVLSGPGQVHDVHTKLRLQHPRGEATQLHKCIVSAPSGEPYGCSQAFEVLASSCWKGVRCI